LHVDEDKGAEKTKKDFYPAANLQYFTRRVKPKEGNKNVETLKSFTNKHPGEIIY